MNRSKLPELGTTIFTVMSRLAQECGAINLSQGFPDFPCDPDLLAGVEQAMREGHNQYAPLAGLPALRTAISHKLASAYGHVYDPESEITVTAGATQGLFTALAALVHPGDEVIVFEPAYDSYGPAITLQGGQVVRVPLTPPDFAIDWSAVARLITTRTRLIIINNPNNPGTSILTAEDLAALRHLAEQHGLWVLSDEVYEHMVFDGQRHHSVVSDPVLAARSLVVYSFGKTFHATGWKVGYCVGPAALMHEFRKVHQYLVFAVSTPMQHALARYLQQPDHYLGLDGFYQRKRDRLRAGLSQTPFRLLPCRGSYFQLADFSALSREPDTVFAERLTREHGVATIPVSVFYADQRDHHLVRFCFAKEDATLDAALARLAKI